MSDVTMKCGFINDSVSGDNNIPKLKNKNLYIFDEVDTILNPLVSELSYPIEEYKHFKNFDSYFNIIFDLNQKGVYNEC